MFFPARTIRVNCKSDKEIFKMNKLSAALIFTLVLAFAGASAFAKPFAPGEGFNHALPQFGIDM